MALVGTICTQQGLDFFQHNAGLVFDIAPLPGGLATEIQGVSMDDGFAHPAVAFVAFDFHNTVLLFF